MEHFYDQPHMGENWFTYPRLYEYVVQKFPSGSQFVELGCWKGKSTAHMAVEIINSGKDIKFDCVDIWAEEMYESAKDVQNLFGDDLYNEFLKNVEPVQHVLNIKRMDSAISANDYADESVDFVFIDADHSYEGVKKDILAWWPKVKLGGIMAGHDYGWHEPIQRAVREIFGDDNVADPWGGGCFLIEKG